MGFLPKIKSFKKLYNFKIGLRKNKYFLYDLIYLFKNNTPSKLILNFYKSNYKKKANSHLHSKYKEFFLSCRFDDFDWFLFKVPLFINYFESKKNNIKNILEIGSYEGRSSIFFLNFFENCKLYCVDTWLGSNEHGGIKMKQVESNFDYNIKNFSNNCIKNKMTSDEYFKKNVKSFDLIFIDGLHYFDQVLKDAENSIKFLNKDGYILFDDYTYTGAGYKKGKNVLNAVNEIISKYKDQFDVIYISEQVLLKKK